mmetsp:Transcript_16358/g.45582  ORF Transcript_16358/g.45582 Transcript_16358/m.45582 type:complete len:203 (+) Transcript_16358:378-986(+)
MLVIEDPAHHQAAAGQHLPLDVPQRYADIARAACWLWLEVLLVHVLEDPQASSQGAAVGVLVPVEPHKRRALQAEVLRGIGEEQVPLNLDQVRLVLRPDTFCVIHNQNLGFISYDNVQALCVRFCAVILADDALVEVEAAGVQDAGHLPRIVPIPHSVYVHFEKLARLRQELLCQGSELCPHAHVWEVVQLLACLTHLRITL